MRAGLRVTHDQKSGTSANQASGERFEIWKRAELRRSALETSRDPVCHELVHGADYEYREPEIAPCICTSVA